MAKTKASLRVRTRNRMRPDLAWEIGGTERSVWILAPNHVLTLGGNTFYGPGVVQYTAGPGGVEWYECDIDSPRFWAWIGRLLDSGLVTGKVRSRTDEEKMPVNRTCEFEDAFGEQFGRTAPTAE